VFIVHIWSQQVYELIAWLRSANQNGRNPIYLVQFLIIMIIIMKMIMIIIIRTIIILILTTIIITLTIT